MCCSKDSLHIHIWWYWQLPVCNNQFSTISLTHNEVQCTNVTYVQQVHDDPSCVVYQLRWYQMSSEKQLKQSPEKDPRNGSFNSSSNSKASFLILSTLQTETSIMLPEHWLYNENKLYLYTKNFCSGSNTLIVML